MGQIKRSPQIDAAVRRDFAAISKADWAELYMDLYRQTHGDERTDADAMQDAKRRLEILKRYR